MRDEILEELWKVKDEIASEAKGNTQALFEHLRTIKLKPSQRLVNLASRPTRQRA